MRDYYVNDELAVYQRMLSIGGFARETASQMLVIWGFYIGPVLTIPFSPCHGFCATVGSVGYSWQVPPRLLARPLSASSSLTISPRLPPFSWRSWCRECDTCARGVQRASQLEEPLCVRP